MLRTKTCLMVVVLMLGYSFTAFAGGVLRDDKTEDDWEILVTPFLFATSLEGSSTVGSTVGTLTLDIDAPFSDLADNLDMAFSLHTEFHRGKWAFVIDPTYLELSADIETEFVNTKLEMEIKLWLIESWAAYKINSNWEVIGGARWQSQELSISSLRSPTLRTLPTAKLDVKDNWLNWIAGVRFSYPLNEKWGIVGRADVAFAGDSDSSYNLQLFFNRKFGTNKALILGYRYFEDDYDNTPKYGWDMLQEGPMIGYTWSF